MKILASLFNFLAFEAAWFAAVTGGAEGWPWLGSLPALAVVLAHLALNRQRLRSELALIIAVTLLGVALETGFMGAGWIRYEGASVLPPVWIAALWFGFATLPNASLAWLKGRWFLQALLGIVAGPLTYWAGVKLGAATLPEGSEGSALFAIGFAWALALPAIFLLADSLTQDRQPVPGGN